MKSRDADVARIQQRLPRLNSRRAKTVKAGKKVSPAMQPSEAIEPAPPAAAIGIGASEPVRKSTPMKQELVAPHEWASLLNNIESESDETRVGGEVMGEVELVSDDLWERLSSTRWIKPPREDFHNDTTIANRPKKTDRIPR